MPFARRFIDVGGKAMWVALVVSMGGMLEWYDFAIFGVMEDEMGDMAFELLSTRSYSCWIEVKTSFLRTTQPSGEPFGSIN